MSLVTWPVKNDLASGPLRASLPRSERSTRPTSPISASYEAVMRSVTGMTRGYESRAAGSSTDGGTAHRPCVRGPGNFRFRCAIILSMASITRRRALAALAPVLGAGAASRLLASDAAQPAQAADGHAHGAQSDGGGQPGANGHLEHASFRRAGGRVDHERNGFHPTALLRDFDWGKTRRLANGRVMREWELVAYEKDIEVAPGVSFAAWTYNGRVPGPTLRAREGERLRVSFRNATRHPHTIHFHGIHPAAMDGVPGLGAGMIEPGG